MAVSQVEVFGLAHVIETSAGVAGTTGWKTDEPDAISKFSAITKSVMRQPISPDRQDRAGTIVDLDANVEWTNDMTIETILDFAEASMMALAQTGQSSTLNYYSPSAVTTTQYTVPSGGALLQGTLVYGTGFTNAGNNGLHVVGASSTGTAIKVASLVTESPTTAQNAQVAVAGYQVSADDLAIAAGTITSTTTDLTTIGLHPGQMIWVGGETSLTKFVNTNNRGYAVVATVAAHTVTFSQTQNTWTTETTTGSHTINLYFGEFIKNVPITDANFLNRTYTFEGLFHQLSSGSADEYGYATAQMVDTAAWELPLAGKGSIKYGFKGFDSATPTTSRDSGASTPLSPTRTTLINSTSNIYYMQVFPNGGGTAEVDFESYTLTFKNNVKPVKVLGTLGGKYTNYGRFSAGAKAKMVMTDETLLSAVRNNTTFTHQFVVRDSTGAGCGVHMPSAKIQNGVPAWTRNDVLMVDVDIMSFKDPTLGYSVGMTMFPYVPAS